MSLYGKVWNNFNTQALGLGVDLLGTQLSTVYLNYSP